MVWSRPVPGVAWLILALAWSLVGGGCRAPEEAAAPLAIASDAEGTDVARGGLRARAAGAVDPGRQGSDYRLGAGDRIRLTTLRHQDLSGEFELDGRGYFTMPLVGQIYAYRRTPRQLENEVEIALRGGGYLVDPRVSVEVLNYRPVYVFGEVQAPGSYPYVGGMTVESALALAGGEARVPEILLSRGGANGPTFAVSGDTALLPGDIIEVPDRAS